MFRHVETLGRTIKVEVEFRFHVPPFHHLWPDPSERGIRAYAGFPGSEGSRERRRSEGIWLEAAHRRRSPPYTRTSRRNYAAGPPRTRLNRRVRNRTRMHGLDSMDIQMRPSRCDFRSADPASGPPCIVARQRPLIAGRRVDEIFGRSRA
jgi:hypothetical protein